MSLQDFELGDSLLATYRFEPDTLTSADEGALVTLDGVAGTKNVMISFHNNRCVMCEPYDNRAQSVAKTLHDAGFARLTNVLTVGTQKVVLQGRTFASAMSFPSESPLEILVTERVVDDLPLSAKKDAIRFITTQFLLDDCAFALASSKLTSSSFTLLGPSYRLDVGLRNGVPHAARIARRRKGWVPSAPVRLLRGAIAFKDATISAALKSINSEALSGSTGAGEYLSCWVTYNELDAHHLRLRLNEFGFVRYTSWVRSRQNDKTVLRFEVADPLPDQLRHESIDVEATSIRPVVDPDNGNIELPDDLVVVGEMLSGGEASKQAIVVPVEDAEWVQASCFGVLAAICAW